MGTQPCVHRMYTEADMWAKGTQLTSQRLTGQQGWDPLSLTI